jgi:Phage gp6-like head-tail connector protein
MSSTVLYDQVNEIALITNIFESGSPLVPADPTTVSCVVTEPAGVAVTHSFGGTAPADITKLSTGKYTLAVPCSPSVAGIDGLWSYDWIGTGVVSDAQPGTWRVLPASLGGWYCGLEELKSRLSITGSNDDYEIQLAIQTVSAWIEDYCGRHFRRITETRTYQPHDIWLLNTDDLVSVTALAVDTDGDGTFEQSWVQNTDYQLRLGERRYNISAAGWPRPYRQVQALGSGKWFPFTWPYTHLDRVQIQGVWGWPSVPPPVTQAALILAADFFKMKDAPFGVAGVSDLGVTRIQQNPWLVELLERLIDSRRKVGV